VGPVEWLLQTVLGLFLWVIIIGAVLSWLVAFDVVNTRNRLVATVLDMTERLTAPVLNPLRKVIPSLGGVDLTPIVAIIGVQFLQRFAVPLIPF
jgi:YggT family protein